MVLNIYKDLTLKAIIKIKLLCCLKVNIVVSAVLNFSIRLV